MFGRNRLSLLVGNSAKEPQSPTAAATGSKKMSLLFKAAPPAATLSPSNSSWSKNPSHSAKQSQPPQREAAEAGAAVMNNNSNRCRLDTEDTERVHNLNLPELLLDEDNPFLECHEHYSPEAVRQALRRKSQQQQQQPLSQVDEEVVDCASTMSSLSSGSFKMRPPPPPPPMMVPPHGNFQYHHPQQQQQEQQAPYPAAPGQPMLMHQQLQPPFPLPPHLHHHHHHHHPEPRMVPPKVICFRVKTEIPDWLVTEDDDERIDQENNSDDLHQQQKGDDDDTAENHGPVQARYQSRQIRSNLSGVVNPVQQQSQQQQQRYVTTLPPFRPRHQQVVGTTATETPANPIKGSSPTHAQQVQLQQQLSQTPQQVQKPNVQLQQQQQKFLILSPVWTEVPSPAQHPRPTMTRFKSVSSSHLFPHPPKTPTSSKQLHQSQQQQQSTNGFHHRPSQLASQMEAFPYSPCTTATATTLHNVATGLSVSCHNNGYNNATASTNLKMNLTMSPMSHHTNNAQAMGWLPPRNVPGTTPRAASTPTSGGTFGAPPLPAQQMAPATTPTHTRRVSAAPGANGFVSPTPLRRASTTAVKLAPPAPMNATSPSTTATSDLHKRTKSCEGSLLGVASLLTAPTMASSSHNSSSRDHNSGNAATTNAPTTTDATTRSTPCTAHAKRTSAVVQEMRLLWTKITRASSHNHASSNSGDASSSSMSSSSTSPSPSAAIPRPPMLDASARTTTERTADTSMYPSSTATVYSMSKSTAVAGAADGVGSGNLIEWEWRQSAHHGCWT